VSESVFEAADALLVPLIPSTLSSRTFDQLRDVVDASARAPRVLGFFSMVDGRKRLHREIMETLSRRQDVLSTAIPTASDVERMGLYRTVVHRSAPRRSAARAFRTLWQEICERLAGQSPH
jgi:cellulose biosynthesis protein BcsQ